MYDRMVVVNIMKSWHGATKGSAIHKHIIQMYNTINPLPRGVKMNTNAAYCAATVSAAFKEAGYDAIFPFECSCGKMIEKAKQMGIWEENDGHIPSLGECIIYDWDDSGKGDDTTGHDHVGMVISVNGNKFTVEEGNKGSSHSVGTRTMTVNGKTIRGFVVPKFDGVPTAAKYPVLARGSRGFYVELLQNILHDKGYSLGIVDKVFGPKTEAALKQFQKEHKDINGKALAVDGKCGPLTWGALLK